MFQLFIAFLVVVDLSLPGISTMDVLAFMEYLAQSGMSPDNITNHITDIRSMSIVYGIDTTPFRDKKIPLFIKSLKINCPLAPVVKILIDQTLLFQIVTVSAHLQFPLVYTPLYLLAFFSFLRISNILPHAAKNFDKTRYLCVGDVVFAFQRAIIVVKWSKTLQDRVKTTTVDIPYLGASALCPIAALERMLATHPAHPDSPLFQIPQADLLSPLTDSAARKHLKQVSSLLGLHRSLTFHDFRRGGGGGGALGPFSMEFPFRTSRPRVPGHPVVYGDILPFLLPSHEFQLHSDHICTPSLFSLPLLGVWGPSLHYQITFLS